RSSLITIANGHISATRVGASRSSQNTTSAGGTLRAARRVESSREGGPPTTKTVVAGLVSSVLRWATPASVTLRTSAPAGDHGPRTRRIGITSAHARLVCEPAEAALQA